MSDFMILHNPRCSKSRQTLEILENSGTNFQTFLYLEEKMDSSFLNGVFKALGKKPSEVLRVKEDEYKAYDIDWSNDEKAIEAIIATPKILERPIVVRGEKAVIGRPPENVKELL